jgi:hypothetical protein
MGAISCWNGDNREGALPCAGQRVAPIFPDAGDAENLAVPTRNRITLAGRVLLKEAVHRHDAPALAVGVAKHPFFGDGFRSRMDRLQFGPGVSIMRNQARSKLAFDREPGLRMSPEDKLNAAGRASSPVNRDDIRRSICASLAYRSPVPFGQYPQRRLVSSGVVAPDGGSEYRIS